jgi:prepilin-type N-terminal cleavage/methylation domain-containing protein
MLVRSVRRYVRALTGHRGQRGFTLPELLVTMVALGIIVLAATVSYIGTMHSWDGTASMTRLQRESSLAVEAMSRTLRGASRVTIGPAGDSLRVYYEVAWGESLATIYHIDNDDQLVDHAGFVLATEVDSLSFSTADGKTINIDLIVRDAMETECSTDDQALLMSSSVVCRN